MIEIWFYLLGALSGIGVFIIILDTFYVLEKRRDSK